jgi:endonuclease/exonuclease/phosphatase family metal-dependent hydrolase
MDYADYPRPVVEDIVRLRRCIERSGLPGRMTDDNLIIGTWNIRSFGRVYPAWDENPDSPKRNLRALACIAEVVRCFDVIAIQEVKRDTSGLRLLLDEFLGPDWGLIVSDVSAGSAGNAERLAFIFDRRRVQPSGLAGEIVLPPTPAGDPAQQFDRTPYIVGFRSGSDPFALLTAHIRYGDTPAARRPELQALAGYVAREIRDRSRTGGEEQNVIVLGDFNIDERKENPLFQAFISTGLIVPRPLHGLKTTFGTQPKYYDQIAWFMGELDLLTTEQAGVIDFSAAVFQELTRMQMSYRVSDHFPLWVEFTIDRSTEQMAQTLGADPGAPDPFEGVPD